MEDNEMSKTDLIATLVAIRKNAEQNNEKHTVELINEIIEEMRKN